MNVINLQHALPQVFVGRDYIDSDIWHQDVSFEKGDFYLIEAASGTGKSSFAVISMDIGMIIKESLLLTEPIFRK